MHRLMLDPTPSSLKLGAQIGFLVKLCSLQSMIPSVPLVNLTKFPPGTQDIIQVSLAVLLLVTNKLIWTDWKINRVLLYVVTIHIKHWNFLVQTKRTVQMILQKSHSWLFATCYWLHQRSDKFTAGLLALSTQYMYTVDAQVSEAVGIDLDPGKINNTLVPKAISVHDVWLLVFLF